MSMFLHGKNGVSCAVKLQLDGLTFEFSVDTVGTGEWPRTTFRVHDKWFNYDMEDAELIDFQELNDLQFKLRKALQGKSEGSETEISFIEPDITFTLRHDEDGLWATEIRVFPYDGPVGVNHYCFTLDKKETEQLEHYLQKMLCSTEGE